MHLPAELYIEIVKYFDFVQHYDIIKCIIDKFEDGKKMISLSVKKMNYPYYIMKISYPNKEKSFSKFFNTEYHIISLSIYEYNFCKDQIFFNNHGKKSDPVKLYPLSNVMNIIHYYNLGLYLDGDIFTQRKKKYMMCSFKSAMNRNSYHFPPRRHRMGYHIFPPIINYNFYHDSIFALHYRSDIINVIFVQNNNIKYKNYIAVGILKKYFKFTYNITTRLAFKTRNEFKHQLFWYIKVLYAIRLFNPVYVYRNFDTSSDITDIVEYKIINGKLKFVMPHIYNFGIQYLDIYKIYYNWRYGNNHSKFKKGFKSYLSACESYADKYKLNKSSLKKKKYTRFNIYMDMGKLLNYIYS